MPENERDIPKDAPHGDKDILKGQVQSKLVMLDTLGGQKRDEIIDTETGKLTTAYLTKVENLLESLEGLDDKDPLKIQTLASVLSSLQGIDSEQQMEKSRAAFSQKIDQFEKKVTARIELEMEVDQWDLYVSRSTAPFLSFSVREVYQKLVQEGKEVTKENLRAFGQYAVKAIQLNGVFETEMSYFQPISPLETLRIYLHEGVAIGFFTGRYSNLDSYLKAFRDQIDRVKADRKECQQLEGFIQTLPGGEVFRKSFIDYKYESGLNPEVQFSNCHPGIVQLYAVLVKKHGISISTIKKVFTQIVSSSQFQALDSKIPSAVAGAPASAPAPGSSSSAETSSSPEQFPGWSSPEELQQFFIEAVLRGGISQGKEKINTAEIERMKAELQARKLFEQERIRLEKERTEYQAKVDEYTSKIESFLSDHRQPDGSLYANLSLDDFEALVILENNLAVHKYNLCGNQIEQKQNEGIYFMVLRHIQKASDGDILATTDYSSELFQHAFKRIGEDASVLDRASSYDAYFTDQKARYFDPDSAGEIGIFMELEALWAQLAVLGQEYDEKDKLCKSRVSRSAELIYRRSLEGGKWVENEFEPENPLYHTEGPNKGKQVETDPRKIVLERKQAKVAALEKKVQELAPAIQREYSYFQEIISQYGSLEFAPAELQDTLKSKAVSFLQLLSTSIGFLKEIKSLHAGIDLLREPGQIAGFEKREERNPDGSLKMKADFGDDSRDLFVKQFDEHRKMFSEITLFLGQKIELPDLDVANPEVQSLLLADLNATILAPASKALTDFAEASRVSSENIASLQKPQSDNRLIRALHGSLYERVRGAAKYQMETMLSAFRTGRTAVLESKQRLQAEIQKDSPLTLKYPHLREMRIKVLQTVEKGLDNLLATVFSPQQEAEIYKTIGVLTSTADEMLASTLKSLAVFVISVAAAVATGGLLAAGAARLAGFLGFVGRTINVVRFVASNVGVATGVTFGSRGAMHLVGWGDQVDWSPGALLRDFGITLGLSLGFTGAGMIVGKQIASRALARTGFTYAELAEAGITKLAFLKTLASPLGLTGSTSAKRTLVGVLKRFGIQSTTETAEEAVEGAGESIHPVLGGLFSLLNSMDGRNVSTKGSQINIAQKLSQLGVSVDVASKKLQFTGPVKDFARTLQAELGAAAGAVKITVQKDGSVSIRINGTKHEVVIHPKPAESPSADLQAIQEIQSALEKSGVSQEYRESEFIQSVQNLFPDNTVEMIKYAAENHISPADFIARFKDGVRIRSDYTPAQLDALRDPARVGPDQYDQLDPATGKKLGLVNKYHKDVETVEEYEAAQKLAYEALQDKIRSGTVDPASIGADMTRQLGVSPTLDNVPLSFDQILSSIESEIDQFVDKQFLKADEALLIKTETRKFLALYRQAFPHAPISKVFEVVRDNARKLAYQTKVDKDVFSGSDHGTRHVLEGDMQFADQMIAGLEAQGIKLSALDKVLIHQVIIDHDTGYTCGAAQAKQGYEASKDHPIFSASFIESNKDYYIDKFGIQGYNIIFNAVLHHSKPVTDFNSPPSDNGRLNPDIIRSITSVVDSLGVTADVKVPEFFRKPEVIEVLTRMRAAMEIPDYLDPSSTPKKPKLKKKYLEAFKRELTIIAEAETNLLRRDGFKKSVDRFFNEVTVDLTLGLYTGVMDSVTVDKHPTTGQLVPVIMMHMSTIHALLGSMFGGELETQAFTKAMKDLGLDEGQRKALMDVLQEARRTGIPPTPDQLIFESDHAIFVVSDQVLDRAEDAFPDIRSRIEAIRHASIRAEIREILEIKTIGPADIQNLTAHFISLIQSKVTAGELVALTGFIAQLADSTPSGHLDSSGKELTKAEYAREQLRNFVTKKERRILALPSP